MAQESNTARTIAVMRARPLSRPLIFGVQQENTEIVTSSLLLHKKYSMKANYNVNCMSSAHIFGQMNNLNV